MNELNLDAEKKMNHFDRNSLYSDLDVVRYYFSAKSCTIALEETPLMTVYALRARGLVVFG